MTQLEDVVSEKDRLTQLLTQARQEKDKAGSGEEGTDWKEKFQKQMAITEGLQKREQQLLVSLSSPSPGSGIASPGSGIASPGSGIASPSQEEKSLRMALDSARAELTRQATVGKDATKALIDMKKRCETAEAHSLILCKLPFK